jgi:hypothetical protein
MLELPSVVRRNKLDFDCNKGDNWPEELDARHSWEYNETGEQAAEIRQHFHMWSWEYRYQPKPPLATVNWEDPRVLSLIVMRDSINRALAKDHWMIEIFGEENEGRTVEQRCRT